VERCALLDLDFQVTGVEPVMSGLVPTLHFNVRITETPATELIQALLLDAQIHFQPGHRDYTSREKTKLAEAFGPPQRWSRTMRNRFWAHAGVNVSGFTGQVETVLPICCTYDLNVLGTKYLYALEDGAAELLFQFSGSMFHLGDDGRVKVDRLSGKHECSFSMPITKWHDLMEFHYPNSASLCLDREVFAALYDYKRRERISSWDEALLKLLAEHEQLMEHPVDSPTLADEAASRVTALRRVASAA
jgi:hypothetical protein